MKGTVFAVLTSFLHAWQKRKEQRSECPIQHRLLNSSAPETHLGSLFSRFSFSVMRTGLWDLCSQPAVQVVLGQEALGFGRLWCKREMSFSFSFTSNALLPLSASWWVAGLGFISTCTGLLGLLSHVTVNLWLKMTGLFHCSGGQKLEIKVLAGPHCLQKLQGRVLLGHCLAPGDFW